MVLNRRDVFVLVEHDRGQLQDVTLEMLGDARPLADRLSGRVCALVPCAGWPILPDWVSGTLAAHGADRVLLMEHVLLEPYVAEAYLQALVDLCQRFDPAMIILAASRNGQDLAPRLAARLQVPYASDCISFQLTPDSGLTATRPVYGGHAHATVTLRDRQPWVVTLRPGAAGVGSAVAGRQAEVERITPGIDPERLPVRATALVEADPATIDLTEAELVVAGGRGASSPDGWKHVQDLADALGASLGATRVAVDQGWAPFERQIGQTGKTVKARLYVACGISGASQHTLGMQQSDLIVAINTDKAAPMMKLAHLAVVGDLKTVIPALVKRIRSLRISEQVTP